MKSWGSVGDSRRDRDRGTYGAVARVLGGYVGGVCGDRGNVTLWGTVVGDWE
jgi:hypothetical protein